MNKVFKVVVFAVGILCVIFLVQNAMTSSTNIYSIVEIKFLGWVVNLPIFVLGVAGVLFGAVVGFLYEYRKVVAAEHRIKVLETEKVSLKNELSKLRNIPIEE